MRLTPILIIYIILMTMLAIVVRELNYCTQQLRQVIHETKDAQGSPDSID